MVQICLSMKILCDLNEFFLHKKSVQTKGKTKVQNISYFLSNRCLDLANYHTQQYLQYKQNNQNLYMESDVRNKYLPLTWLYPPLFISGWVPSIVLYKICISSELYPHDLSHNGNIMCM